MRIQELDAGTESRYEELLAKSPTVLMYHSLKYRNFLRKILSRSTDCYLLALEGERVVAALPAFIKHGACGAVVNSLPFCGSNGAIVAEEGAGVSVKRALLDAFDDLCRRERAITSTLVSNPLNPDSELFAGYGADLLDMRIGQLTPLPAEPNPDAVEDRLMALFHSKTRNIVRKGLKSGFVLAHDDSMETLRRLQDIHVANMQAVNGPVKPWAVCEAIRGTFAYDTDYRVYTAKKDGEVRAALLVFFYNGIAEYYMPAIQEDYRAEQPLSGLILAAMKDAVGRGCRWWNWGGTGLALDGVYHFKSRWGTQDMNYWYHTKFHVDAAGPKSLSKEELLREYPYFFVLPFKALENKLEACDAQQRNRE